MSSSSELKEAARGVDVPVVVVQENVALWIGLVQMLVLHPADVAEVSRALCTPDVRALQVLDPLKTRRVGY